MSIWNVTVTLYVVKHLLYSVYMGWSIVSLKVLSSVGGSFLEVPEYIVHTVYYYIHELYLMAYAKKKKLLKLTSG